MRTAVPSAEQALGTHGGLPLEDSFFLKCSRPHGGHSLQPPPHALDPVADSLAAAAETLSRVREELDRQPSAVRRSVEAGDSAATASWPRIVVVVDEVAELTVRNHGDDQAAPAAQQAATGRLCEIARLGRSVDIHLVCCTQRPHADAVPGQLKANLDGTVAFRGRAAVNNFILLDSDKASLLPPHGGRAIFAHETLDEFQAVDCSVDPLEGLGDMQLLAVQIDILPPQAEQLTLP